MTRYTMRWFHIDVRCDENIGKPCCIHTTWHNMMSPSSSTAQRLNWPGWWFQTPAENDESVEPCSKCLTSWHQIRKCLRHCFCFAYARTGFGYPHIFSYAELTLAYAHHSFAYTTPLQGAPCLTWTQGFRTWLNNWNKIIHKIHV